MGLHNSHYHGRGKWGVRFEIRNCSSICYGCHQYLGSHPTEHTKFMKAKLGEKAYDELLELANDTKLGRLAKRSEKEIRAHYRQQLERMKSARASGETGYLFLENWQ